MRSNFAHSSQDLREAGILLRAALHLHSRSATPVAAPAPIPFVTISRQSGAAGRAFAYQLVQRLNQIDRAGGWTCWDHELVEKVSAEHEIEKAIVEMLEDGRHSWINDLLESLASGNAKHHPDEFKVFQRVAVTIQALARAGRAVIVGRGGIYLTSSMPAGVHVRVVAPLADRIAHVVERDGVSQKQAQQHVVQTERNREAFHRRHWPRQPLTPERFTITLNSASLSQEEMINCLVPLLDGRLCRSAEQRAHCSSAGSQEARSVFHAGFTGNAKTGMETPVAR